MQREDIIGLGMAYLGCIWLTLASIFNFAYGTNIMFRIMGVTCVSLFSIIMIRKEKQFTKAFRKMKLYFKFKLSKRWQIFG